MSFGEPPNKSNLETSKMTKKRLISRLDIKNDYVIKGINLEGLRKVGDPNTLAKRYYNQGIDEIILMDAVAAYYGRNSLFKIIEKASEDVFIPITVGGGIRTIGDIKSALKSGADKVAINTEAVKNPNFVTEASETFGSQCIVASIEAKRMGEGSWNCYTENGREPTNLSVLTWAKELENLGAGEILITSVDAEGTKRGADLDLLKAVSKVVSIPLIVCGGVGSVGHCIEIMAITGVDALAVSSILHYNVSTVQEIKSSVSLPGIKVRK